MQLKDLQPHQKNPRKISKEKLALLKASLEKFGDLSGFVFNRRSQRMVSGHQRQKSVPPDAEIVIEQSFDVPTGSHTVALGYVQVGTERFRYREVDADEQWETEAMLAANKHGGEWDVELLKENLQAFPDLDLASTGFDLDELGDMGIGLSPTETGPSGGGGGDVAPEPPVQPKSKKGDLWVLGRHRLLCGDSTNILDVDQLMDGEKADMIFTDPPYGVSYTGGHNEKKREGIQNDSLEGDDLTNLFISSLLNATTCAQEHAAYYIWYANGKAVETFAAFAKLPLKVRAVICWYKIKSGLGAFMSQYIPNYEPCIYAFREGCSPQWFGPTDEKTVWELQRVGANEFHPTQKPVDLAERALRNSTKPGNRVLDLFGGSGATLIACEKHGRQCFMMELDPRYVDVILRRWAEYTGEDPVRDDGVTWFELINANEGTENI